MKLLTATIRPLDWEPVYAALRALGLSHIEVTEVQVFDRSRSRATLYRGAQFIVDHVPQYRLNVAVPDGMVACAIAAIAAIADAQGASEHEHYAVTRVVDQRSISEPVACPHQLFNEEIF